MRRGLYKTPSGLLVYIRHTHHTGQYYVCYMERGNLIESVCLQKDIGFKSLPYFKYPAYPFKQELAMLEMLDKKMYERVERMLHFIKTGDW